MAVVVNSAVYGLGTYGNARYGKVIVSNLDQVVGAGQVNTVKVNLVKVLSGTPSTVTLGTFKVGVTEKLVQVFAVGSANPLKINVKEVLAGVVGVFTLNGGGLSIRSVNRVPVIGVTSSGIATTTQQNIGENLSPIGAIVVVGTLQVNLKEVVSSVSVSGSVNSVVVNTGTTLTGTQGVFSLISVKVNLKENLNSVVANGYVVVPRVSLSEKLNFVQATGLIGSIATNSNDFNFEAVKNLYSRNRTVYVARAA